MVAHVDPLDIDFQLNPSPAYRVLPDSPAAWVESLDAYFAGRHRDVDPDRFDLFRETSGQLAFGFGPHDCLGAVLARAETGIALGQVFERMPTLRPVPDRPAEWTPPHWKRGPKSVPVAV